MLRVSGYWRSAISCLGEMLCVQTETGRRKNTPERESARGLFIACVNGASTAFPGRFRSMRVVCELLGGVARVSEALCIT